MNNDSAITQRRDPDTMPENARLAEVATILAQGFLRLLTSRKESQKELDVLRPPTAPCVSVNGGRAVRKETA